MEDIDAIVSEPSNTQNLWTAMSDFAGIACTVSILYRILNNLGGTMDNPGISPQSSQSNGACTGKDLMLAEGRDLDAHRHHNNGKFDHMFPVRQELERRCISLQGMLE